MRLFQVKVWGSFEIREVLPGLVKNFLGGWDCLRHGSHFCQVVPLLDMNWEVAGVFQGDLVSYDLDSGWRKPLI